MTGQAEEPTQPGLHRETHLKAGKTRHTLTNSRDAKRDGNGDQSARSLSKKEKEIKGVGLWLSEKALDRRGVGVPGTRVTGDVLWVLGV